LERKEMKMTDAIRLPRTNSKILVLTSFILICAIMFLTVLPALAWHCGWIKLLYDLARVALSHAVDLWNWLRDIGAPQWMIDTAEAVVHYLWDRVIDLRDAYEDCLEEHDSGGCDTGGCDTGGCDTGGCG
jgi:hypothetical protein